MPYVDASSRERLEYPVEILEGVSKLSAGDLNYLITKLVAEHWRRTPRYTTIAEITGVLENVKQEFYRRVASPYEDRKIAENGDVF